MKKKYTIYGIFDGDKLVYQGSYLDVMATYNVSEEIVYQYARKGKKIHGQYGIKKVGVGEKEYFLKEPKHPKPKKKEWSLDTPIEYLKWHLKLYGNTICQFDPVPYLPELLDEGLNCRVKEVKDSYTTIHKRGRPPKGKFHYYVEVV